MKASGSWIIKVVKVMDGIDFMKYPSVILIH